MHQGQRAAAFVIRRVIACHAAVVNYRLSPLTEWRWALDVGRLCHKAATSCNSAAVSLKCLVGSTLNVS
jgi:hypothetical protein